MYAMEPGSDEIAILHGVNRNQPDQDMMPSSASNYSSSFGSPRMNHSMTVSQASPDINLVKNENRALKAKIRQVQFELQTEQDQVSNLRKRLNTLERDRLDNLAKSNEDVGRLDADVARLRAQVEKGEAIRQNLEFELAKAQKEISQEQRASNNRESVLNELTDSMKAKISELSQEKDNLARELTAMKNESYKEISKLNDTLSEKNIQITKMQSEYEMLQREKERLENALKQQESLASDLDERLREIEGEKRENTEVLRKQIYEYDIVKDREERLNRDLELAMDRVRNLEENIEAERAAHLESKFNSEIVQLRIRDLESAINFSKTAKIEAEQKSERLSQQLMDLQKIFEAERKTTLEDRNQLEKDLILKCVLPATRAEKEYALLNNQLTFELQEKKNFIARLSEQLELHQINFDELREELSKAKKQQMFFEQNFGSTSKELEAIITSYWTDSSVTLKKPPKKKKDSSETPSVQLENLRALLSDLKRNLDNTTSELSKLKTQHEKTNKDCAQFQELAAKREKALQTNEQNVTRVNKEMKKLKSQLADLEKAKEKLSTDLKTATSNFEKERKENSSLKEQSVKTALQSRSEKSNTLEYLHSLYQQLLTGKIMEKPFQGTDISKFSYPELTILIKEQVAVLINSLLREGEKTKHLENVISTKDQMLQQMQKAHEQNMQKMALTSEERMAGWLQQRSEMEDHYTAMLTEIQERHKKSQDMADQAWEKIRTSGSIQKGLEEESNELREQLAKITAERQTLLATNALLIGALYPLYGRLSFVISERQFLMDCLSKFLTFKNQVKSLVDALSPTQGQKGNSVASKDPFKPTKMPILRFRKAVIAVLAANRLANGSLKYCQLFTAYDPFPGVLSSIVCVGQVRQNNQEFVGVANENAIARPKGPDEESAREWLGSDKLMSIVMSSMADLHYNTQTAESQDLPYSNIAVANVARTCFGKLLNQFSDMFPHVAVPMNRQVEAKKSSLSRQLAAGLSKIVAQQLLIGEHPLPNSQNIMGRLQREILQFTKRLHQTERERRDLRQEVTRLAQTSQGLAQSTHISKKLQDDLSQLKLQLGQSVSKERFLEVCKELEASVNREKEAEKLLSQQAGEIQEISSHLNRYISEGGSKQLSLTEMGKALSDAKVELRHQEQLVRQLNRQLKQDDEQKKSLQSNLRDAETALRTAVKDKETLILFIKNVQNSLEKIKQNLSAEGPLSKADLTALLSPDLVPVSTSRNRQSPELTACQVLIAAFVECQQQFNLRTHGLQEALKSHKDHITKLKKELNAVCERQYSSELQMKYTDFPLNEKKYESAPEEDSPVMGSPRPSKLKEDKEFSPLLEDSTDTLFGQAVRSTLYGMPKPSNHKKGQKNSKKT